MDHLPHFSLLSAWPAEKQRQFIQPLAKVSYKNEEVIFRKNDPSTDAYFIISGAVKSLNYGATGLLSYFRLREAGDCFGYYSAISGAARTATMVSVGVTRLAKVSANKFSALTCENPEIAKSFQRLIIDLLRTDTERLTRLTLMPAQERVVAELITLAAGQTNSFKIPSRVEWSSYFGVTRETLSRILNDLVQQGIITLSKNQVTVIDPDNLKALLQ